jgi:hypothetical protein
VNTSTNMATMNNAAFTANVCHRSGSRESIEPFNRSVFRVPAA